MSLLQKIVSSNGVACIICHILPICSSVTLLNLNGNSIEAIGDIVGGTRIELNTESPRISTMISTRNSVEMASLIYDGFSLEEAAEVCIYPQFDNAGGID